MDEAQFATNDDKSLFHWKRPQKQRESRRFYSRRSQRRCGGCQGRYITSARPPRRARHLLWLFPGADKVTELVMSLAVSMAGKEAMNVIKARLFRNLVPVNTTTYPALLPQDPLLPRKSNDYLATPRGGQLYAVDTTTLASTAAEKAALSRKKVEVSLRLFDMFQSNTVFIFLCRSFAFLSSD